MLHRRYPIRNAPGDGAPEFPISTSMMLLRSHQRQTESRWMSGTSNRGRRGRLSYFCAIIVVIGTGLLLRSGLFPREAILVKYGGDALWALMVFLACGWLAPAAPTFRLASAALIFSWAVEFLQLYHAPWIDGIRSTLPGRLVLGQTFNPPDLLAYVVGIAIGAGAEPRRIAIVTVERAPRGE